MTQVTSEELESRLIARAERFGNEDFLANRTKATVLKDRKTRFGLSSPDSKSTVMSARSKRFGNSKVAGNKNDIRNLSSTDPSFATKLLEHLSTPLSKPKKRANQNIVNEKKEPVPVSKELKLQEEEDKEGKKAAPVQADNNKVVREVKPAEPKLARGKVSETKPIVKTSEQKLKPSTKREAKPKK